MMDFLCLQFAIQGFAWRNLIHVFIMVSISQKYQPGAPIEPSLGFASGL
jgi:hypothetical protein